MSPSAINAPADRQLPSQFTTVELNEQQLRQLALEAPLEFSPEAAQHGIIVALPMPDGSLERFEVVESPLLPTKLSMKFPKIRSYRGTSLDHPEWVTRFGLTYRGFHGAIRTPSGTVAIDHLYDEPSAYYMSYYSNDSDLEHSFRCGVGNTVIDDNDYFGPSPSALASSPANNRTGDAVIFRVYDMALACTGEFANWHGNTVAGVMSAFDAGMNRLNLIFESEMAIRFQLIEDNDELIFTNAATDPFNMANMGRELLGQNQAFLDGVVGLENYDIGHIFTGPCSDVGGVVSGATCTNGKGRGVTCNFSANVTGAVANIMAHEVGHQFSAGHTWSNCPGNEGQLASGSAFEPGSGTTIMSYAGACGNQNIQFNSDEYFHVGSLTEMTNFVESAGTCNDFITPVNTYPEFDWPYTDGFYIPVNTYFELEAPATDMDGDDLTYCWEQYNLGPTSPIGTPFANAPSFRSFPPTSSPKRFFPRLQNILTNTSTDFEVLPKISRRMTFRCTVRDNNEEVGGNVFREVDFEATETAGPFRVSHPDLDPVTWEAGDYTEVTWNVASTDNSLVNCKEVNILLSTDGGQSFPFVLAANAPNDGSQFITVPDVETTFARVRVEAANNIFFDINSANFEIIPATTPGYTFEALPYIQDICLPEEINISLSSGSVLGYDSLITLSVDGLPDGAMAEFSTNPITPSDDAMLIINTEEVDVTGIFEVEIMAVAPSADTSFRTVILDIVSNDFSSLALVEPSNGTNGAPEVPEFSWVGSDNALTYIIDIATSPSFDPATIVETGEGISGTKSWECILYRLCLPYSYLRYCF
ncbi:MAG: reprolysin-like metallopeptidase [Bacteroidota bacterium]